jgi:hypothetical protein
VPGGPLSCAGPRLPASPSPSPRRASRRCQWHRLPVAGPQARSLGGSAPPPLDPAPPGFKLARQPAASTSPGTRRSRHSDRVVLPCHSLALARRPSQCRVDERAQQAARRRPRRHRDGASVQPWSGHWGAFPSRRASRVQRLGACLGLPVRHCRLPASSFKRANHDAQIARQRRSQ